MIDRGKFESFISGPPYEKDISRLPEDSAWPGSYRDPEVDLAWLTWEAAVAYGREVDSHVCKGIAAGYAGKARHLSGREATYSAGQRDGANECASAIRKGGG